MNLLSTYVDEMKTIIELLGLKTIEFHKVNERNYYVDIRYEAKRFGVINHTILELYIFNNEIKVVFFYEETNCEFDRLLRTIYANLLKSNISYNIYGLTKRIIITVNNNDVKEILDQYFGDIYLIF